MSHLLVVLPSWLGDTVMAEPALRALRLADPDLRLTALGRPGLAEVLEGTGLIDAAIVHDLRGVTGPLNAARAVRRAIAEERLRSGSILLLPNSTRSALTARLIPARRRVGFATELRRLLLTDAITPPPRRMPVAAVDWYAQLVERAFDLTIQDRLPRLRPTAAQERAAREALQGCPPPFALLVPGANRVDKRWPSERFGAVGRFLRDQGFTVLVSGSPPEAAITASVAAACSGVDLARPGLALGTLLGVIARTKLMVSNDTGPRHLAIGLGVPTVSLFGPTDPRWTTVPAGPERRLLGEPFLPEEEFADRRPRLCRMDRIEVTDVQAAIVRLLGGAGDRASLEPSRLAPSAVTPPPVPGPGPSAPHAPRGERPAAES